MAIKRINPGPRLSQAVVHGDTIYLAGQVADDASQPAGGQTRQILAQIDALLAKAGSDKTKLLWANVWLADMADFAAMNEAWEAWIPEGHTPARATVEAKLALPKFKVEIACIAARGAKRAPARSAKRAAKRTAKPAGKPAARKRR
ncbi:MAG: RidA family protein [Rhodospirillaceae bacterium]|nr:RidA family protein [Rhodospirillaceae bacterium]